MKTLEVKSSKTKGLYAIIKRSTLSHMCTAEAHSFWRRQRSHRPYSTVQSVGAMSRGTTDGLLHQEETTPHSLDSNAWEVSTLSE